MLLFFGGTFDPPHLGHFRCAEAAAAELGAAQTHWVPAGNPPHREALASAEDRAAMTGLAIGERSDWRLDRCELDRGDGVSYTVDSLIDLRRRVGADRPLCLLLGADQLQRLPSWHRCAELDALTHLAVLPRPGADAPLPQNLMPPWHGRVVESPERLHSTPCGFLFVLKTSPLLAISSSGIRGALARGHRPKEISPAVFDYIGRRGLYGWPENTAGGRGN